MSRTRVILLSASLLTIAAATPLTAQRLEVAVRAGFSPPTGTQLRVNGFSSSRSWEGRAVSLGVLATYWPLSHFGVQGTVDLRRTRAYATWTTQLPPFGGTVDTTATQLAVSLRLAVRQAVGQRLQFAASLGPTVIRFSDAEYGQILAPFFLRRTSYGIAGEFSAAYAVSSHLSLTVSTADVVYRLQQKAVALPINVNAPEGEVDSVEAPMWHQFTVRAGVSFRVL